MTSIFWFRRSLRLQDNHGLFMALSQNPRVLPVFIFDTDILEKLPANDHRVNYIYQTLKKLHQDLTRMGSTLLVLRGKPMEVFSRLIDTWPIESVYCNADHEPYGRSRDEKIRALLDSRGIHFHSFTDHLLMSPNQVLKDDGKPYHVFTPFSRKWKQMLSPSMLKPYPSTKHAASFIKVQELPPAGEALKSLPGNAGHPEAFPEASSLQIETSVIPLPTLRLRPEMLQQYAATRDFPALEGTSQAGLYLRFGTLSVREAAAAALKYSETFLNELIWREFYASILWHYPWVETKSFKPGYDSIQWLNNPDDFRRWKQGQTGYPLVDAGMRQLMATGYMHNRVRMVTASFLSKHLLIDWRWGEAWFASLLYDYELSSNNGGWQWSAGTGSDAAPYFRIFNPTEQHRRFDPESRYVSRWVPEFNTPAYPAPMVNHALARERCLNVYRQALDESRG